MTPDSAAGDGGPLLLAIETATRATGVALLRGEVEVAAHAETAGRPTAEVLLPAIAALLGERGLVVADLDGFAISIGPGSFTSLRVGLATLKGLAFGDARPVALVPTLAALALTSAQRELPVVPLLDARRGEAYAAAYDLASGEAAPLLPEGVHTPGELAALLPAACVLVGETEPFAAAIRECLGCGVRLGADAAPTAHVLAVGRLGARMLARGEGTAPAAAVPRYVRRAEAEVKRTGRRFESPQGL